MYQEANEVRVGFMLLSVMHSQGFSASESAELVMDVSGSEASSETDWDMLRDIADGDAALALRCVERAIAAKLARKNKADHAY